MKKLLGFMMAMGLLSTPAFCANNPTGSDACGLGWDVVKTKSLFGTWTRATTNTFLPPTFSMTSGTSGCDQHLIAQADEDGARYASVNREALAVEMAQGSGEYLTGLAKIMGCSDEVVPSFHTMTQKNYQTLMGSASTLEDPTGLELYLRIQKQVQQDPTLSLQCGHAV